jgi:NTE family protein
MNKLPPTQIITAKYADLVMEGGGVKAAGLIGAVEALYEQGYQFPRIAGASAGAIVGALLAAGMPPPEARKLLTGLSFRRFRDPTLWSRLGPGPLGQAASILFTRGIHRGHVLQSWMADQLATYNVRTFKNLRITEEWAHKLPPAQRYKLVVIVADIGRGRLLRLPWDYHLLGRDPDTQLVADAVRASTSIPFFYQPVKLGSTLLVDGGLLSNFPVDTFDAYPSEPSWPTFGIKLSAKEDANMVSNNFHGPFGFPLALLDTLVNAYDQVHLDDPAATSRTIFVDTGKIKATDFSLTRAGREALRVKGKAAASQFLTSWDYGAYLKTYVQPRLQAAAAAIGQKNSG